MSGIIGRNLRAWREIPNPPHSQDYLARLLRMEGLDWSRSQLAKVERGERPVSIEELFQLIIILGFVPAWFLRGEPDEWVTLSPKVSVRPHVVSDLMNPVNPASGGWLEDLRLNVPLANPPAPDPAWPELDGHGLAVADAWASGESERKVAARLGVDSVVVARGAWVCWGHSLVDERDARVRAQVPENAAARTIQAARGHVSRALVNELRQALADRKPTTKKGKKK